MTFLRTLLVFTLAVAATSGIRADSQPAAATPPQQSAPWRLPDGVDDADGEIKTTVNTLFGLGLADPRGCSYRHVAIMQGGVKMVARGWVLPDSKNVIGWNGLVYPVEDIGKEADLAADVEILKQNGEFAEAPFSNYQDESLDDLLSRFAGSPRMMRSWAAPYLLLRLGVPVQFDQTSPDPFSETSYDFSKGGKLTFPMDWYFDSENEWIVRFGLLVRGDGVAAFIDGNDRLAAARLPLFDRVWAEVEKRCPEVEGEREVDPFSDTERPPTRPQLNSAWRSVLSDSQRRIEPAPVVKLSEIERNIDAWDLLESWDEENTPEVFDKVVAAGPAAINPLLDCLGKDTRWTRIRRHGANRDPGELLRVRDFAIIALERILRFPVLEVPNEREPVEDTWYVDAATTMRAFCDKYEHACGGQLWFRVLRDESADLDLQWIAAKRIVRPDGVEDYYPDMFVASDARQRFDDPRPSEEGKLLRGRHDPSVLDLLKQAYFRARKQTDEQLAKGVPESAFPVFPHGMFAVPRRSPTLFMRLVEEWKPGNVDLLKSHYDWLEMGLLKLRKANADGEFEISSLCEEALIRRFWAEDPSAMGDYENFFQSSFESNNLPLNVMKEFPEEPGMDQLAREAFLGDKAPLNFTKPWRWGDSTRKNLIATYGERLPLLVLPAFRQALIEALRTTTKQATLTLTEDGGILKYDAGKFDETDSVRKDAALWCSDPVGTTIDVRLCDLIAYLLTPRQWRDVWVSPAFHLDAPLPERDRAIADWLRVLDR